jgi:GxxExxY protein
MHENDISDRIINASIKIHRKVGPGMLESVYEELLAYELATNYGLSFNRQKGLPVVYDNIRMELGFRTDLVVENKVIVEIKSIETVAPVHFKQILTYLRMSNLRLGLLINFNQGLLKDGLYRVVNNL